VRSQERDDLGSRAKRIGDGRAIAQRKGSAELAVDLGHQHRCRRRAGGAVEAGEAQQPELVVGIARSDEDLGAERMHVTMVTRPGHKGK
jgi:hypothetical protein